MNKNSIKTKPYKPGFGWKLYMIFIWSWNIQMTFDFFYPGSPVHLYYQVRTSFDTTLWFMYMIDAGAVILNLLNVVPVFLFVYRKLFLSPRAWQWLLVGRLIFDILGHSYEKIMIKSLFIASVSAGVKISIGLFLVLLPSYIACFLYAFKQDKVIPPQQNLF